MEEGAAPASSNELSFVTVGRLVATVMMKITREPDLNPSFGLDYFLFEECEIAL